MKKIAMMAGMAVLVMGLAGGSHARTLFLINTDKGELPTDVNAGCSVSLSGENASKGGKMTMKIEIKGYWFTGQYEPKQSKWGAYDRFVFDAFNPGRELMTVNLCVKQGDKRCDRILVLKPGANKLEAPIVNATTSPEEIDGAKAVVQWNISQVAEAARAGTVLFVSNFRLESDDAAESAAALTTEIAK